MIPPAPVPTEAGTPSVRTVLRGGTIVAHGEVRRGDVAISGDRILAVGEIPSSPGDRQIDCRQRLILPGFIDAHSHVDGAIFDPHVQHALLRQGITSAVIGQDGVSYAPGDGQYATEYFAAINGPHPTYPARTGSVAELLATYDEQVRVNIGYLVPAGTVRHEVCGSSTAPADAEQVHRMQQLVAQALADGAVGLSTGLDYVPGIFAGTEEIIALCRPLTGTTGIYVSHMRGGYEQNSRAGVEEIARIATSTGVGVHISHFHADAALVLALLAELGESNIDVTFDAYPYVRGCTLVAMALLPAELLNQPVDEVLSQLRDPQQRRWLREQWFARMADQPSLGPHWPEMITIGHTPAPEFSWVTGHTLAAAAAQLGRPVIDFTLDLLVASRLEVNATMSVRHERTSADLARIFRHASHHGGSDGIFIGAHGHPRSRGSFARYLREFVREQQSWTWADAVTHLAAGPAARFDLADRGVIAAGYFADVIIVDPDRVADRATYDDPMRLSEGIEDVFVNGRQVLVGGELTDARPGRGLRRGELAGAPPARGG